MLRQQMQFNMFHNINPAARSHKNVIMIGGHVRTSATKQRDEWNALTNQQPLGLHFTITSMQDV